MDPLRNDLTKLLDAVTEMRAAQKLEMDALPSNLRVWKRTRQQLRVAQLEQQVDELVKQLQGEQNQESNK